MRTIVITGANTGIGRTTALGLNDGATRFILAGRSLSRTQTVIDELAPAQVEFVELDLGSLASVRKAAARIRELAPHIDILINNAGIGGVHGKTVDGFELHFGVNHLGHFLLTQELLPLLKASNARVVNVASDAHRMVKKTLDFAALEKPTATRTGFPEYGVSKLCNILFTRELAKRHGLRTYALHPGVIATDIWREVPAPLRFVIKLFMASPDSGAKTSIHCATADIPAEENGTYFEKSKRRRVTKLAEDDALARELWDRSEGWVAADA